MRNRNANHVRRLLAMLLALVMVLSILPAAAFAAEPDVSAYSNSLTLNKPVTVSGAAGDAEAGSKAVDGDASTKWAALSTQAKADDSLDAAGGSCNWLEVDLGAEATVASWQLLSKPDDGAPQQLTKTCKLQVKNAEGKWQTVDSVTDNTVVNLQRDLESPITGRYFRVWFPDTNCNNVANDNHVRIAEFHLFEGTFALPAPYEGSLTLNQTVKASGEAGAAEAAAKAVDGDNGTKWAALSTQAQADDSLDAAGGKCNWLQVDLAEPATVKSWQLLSMPDGNAPQQLTKTCKLQVKNAEGKWETVDSVTNNTVVDLQRDLASAVTGQSFRIWFPDTDCNNTPTDNHVRIAEFHLFTTTFNPEQPEEPETPYSGSLTLKQTVKASGEAGAAEAAAKAVDGDDGTKWAALSTQAQADDSLDAAGGKCNWLQVDLAAPATVKSWQLLSKPDDNAPYQLTKTCKLQVKNAEGKWETVDSVTNNQEVNLKRDLSAAVTGQSFRVWFPDTDCNNVATDNHVRIAEFHLFTTTFNPEQPEEPEEPVTPYTGSLTLGKTAKVNGQNGAEVGDLALDGNGSTKWCALSSMALDGQHWLEVDLGQAATVKRWRVENCIPGVNGDVPGMISSDLNLQVQEDGQWKTVAAVSGNTTQILELNLDTAVTGQVFRLMLPARSNPHDGHVRIHEFHLYADASLELAKADLSAALKTVEALDGSAYTKESWEAVQMAVEAANAKLADAAATADALIGAKQVVEFAVQNLQMASKATSFQSEFSDTIGFVNVQDRAEGASMSTSISGGMLRVNGSQAAAGHGYAYQTIYSGLELVVDEAAKLTYIIDPSESPAPDYPSLHVAIDLKFDDGTYLSQLGVEDENCVDIHPNAQGEAKAMTWGQDNLIIVPLAACAGKTVTDILVGYENVDGVAGASYAAAIDNLKIQIPTKTYDSLADYVTTLRGSNPSNPYEMSRGAAHPFTTLPHGFNFWTPENVGGLGIYDYNAGYISSFRISHQANFHIGDPAAWNFMVTNGTSGNTAYDHANETANAHYYSVEFNKESGKAAGTRVEISPTMHGASVRVSYDKGLSKRGIELPGLTVNADGTIHGTVSVTCTNGGWNTMLRKMYFYGTVDAAVESVSGNTVYFAESGDKTVVTMNLATSFISEAQAKANYDQELTGKTFDETFEAAKQTWNDALGVIEIEGATEDQKITFYSNLYRVYLYPTDMSEYTEDGWKYFSVYTNQVEDGKLFYNNGFWDTYRTAWPLYSLLEPSQETEMLNGILNYYDDNGWVPRWITPAGIDCMVGTSSDIIFGDALMRGVEFDLETAYEAALKNATMSTYAGAAGGRKGQNTGLFYGYVPDTTGNGMSWSMSGYLDDFGIAQMAKAVGDLDSCTYLMNRAQNYVHLFDQNGQWFRGKSAAGQWSTQAPLDVGAVYEETNAWNMAFSVPHDGQGLVNLYGSKAALEAKLDALFATNETGNMLCGGPSMINEMKQVKMGQLMFNNEPALHIPYMYLFAGAPAKTQEVVRALLRQCYTSSQIGAGFVGDEDNGALAGWYVFSAMGLYPLNVGTGELVFGSPLFTKATIHLENGKDIVINAPNNSSENIYVANVKVNGQDYAKTSILQTDLTDNGAVIDFEMTNEPSDWGAESAPASITAGDESAVPVADFDGNVSAPAALSDNDSLTDAKLNPVDGVVSIEVSYDQVQCVSLYTLTSAGDPASAPAAFALYGSNDGKTWTLLDQRTGETFLWNTQTRAFVVENAGYYAEYRLDIQSETPVTLAEVEFMGNNQESVSREMLLALIETAEALDLTAYPASVQTEIQETLAAVKAVAANEAAGEDELNTAFADLQKGVFAVVNALENLQALYNEYADASANSYTASSWQALETALTKAKAVLESDRWTAASLAEAYEALTAAVEGLELNYDYSASLTLNKPMSVSCQIGDNERGAYAVDGKPSTKWCTLTTTAVDGQHWLEVDLGQKCIIDRWRLENCTPGINGDVPGMITSDFEIQVKVDNFWKTIVSVSGNSEQTLMAELDAPVTGQVFRLLLPARSNPHDGHVRIHEFHLYGEVFADPDAEAAKAVDALIAQIGAAETSDKAKIEAARDAFDALTDAQKALVTKLNLLTAAEYYWSIVDAVVALTVTGSDEVYLADETTSFTVHASGCVNTALLVLTMEADPARITDLKVQVPEGCLLLAETYENGKLNVVIGSVDGFNGDIDVMTVTGQLVGGGEAELRITEAKATAYLPGDNETYVDTDLTNAGWTVTVHANIYDVNRDGIVDLLDVTRAQRHYGEAYEAGDVNGDDIVNIEDLILIIVNFTE